LRSSTKKGKENKAADALSRKGENGELNAFSLWQLREFPEWEAEIQQDEKLRDIYTTLVKGRQEVPGYCISKGCLTYNGRLVLPKNSSRIPMLLKEFHDGPLGGHSGPLRTFKRMSGMFYWEGMRKDIQRYIAMCDVCQKNKYLTLSPAGLLQPLPIPQQVWEDVSLDFITGLPKSQRFDVILVVVDRLTKYGHFIPLAHPFTAKEVAEVFAKEVV